MARHSPLLMSRKVQWWRLVWIWVIVVIALFASWDFVERTYLPHLSVEALRTAHLIRGVLGASLTSALAVWLILRRLQYEEELIHKHHDLHKQLELFYNAFEHSSDAILITDLKGVIIELNHAFTKMFGYAHAEAKGHTTRLLRSRYSTDEFYQEMWRSMNTKGEWKGEIINQAKDGAEIPIWLTITPIYDSGKRIGYMGIEIDLREKKKLEENLLRAERLATIGRMSAQAAHEIRNPLSSVSLNAELLKEELENLPPEPTTEARHLLAAITQEVERLSLVSEDYLKFSRLPRLALGELAVNDILKHLEELVRLEAAQHHVALSLKLEEKLPAITGDSKQLEQAFFNVIKNAFEAMPSGGTLTITTYARESHIEVQFSDTGCGMNQATQAQLFDPFFSTKDRGTGLGMAIILQIVEEHQGTVQYTSNVGTGTTFTIALPRARLPL